MWEIELKKNNEKTNEIRKWCRLLLFFPLLFFLFYVNVEGDASNVFHNVNYSIAKSLLQGKAAGSSTGNENEREIKKYLIQGMPKKVDVLAIGPSLITYLGKEAIRENTFYNLGVTNGDHYDMMAQFMLLQENNIHFKKVVLTIDPAYFTDDSYVKDNVMHDALMPYSEAMLRYLRDGKFPGKKKSKIYDFWQTTISKWRSTPLFSLSYFQSSLPFVLDGEGSRLLDVEAHPEKLYYEPDGSRHQTEHMQNASIEDVKREVQSLDYTVFDCTLETKRKEEFEQLLDYLEKQGVTVEFWICPLSPSLWNSLNKQKYPIFEELEGYANLVARRKKIHISGSFNPDTVGVSDADFYDARHMKRKSIARFFTF